MTYKHMYFYVELPTMIASLDGYALAGWEFLAWVDTEWKPDGVGNELRRAALFRRPTERTT